MGQIKLTAALLMIGLFSIAVLTFAINFAGDNSAAVDISDDPEMNSLYSQSKSNVSGFNKDAEDTYESIIDTTVEPGSQTAPSTGPFAVTPLNAIGIVQNIMETGYKKIFGTGSGFGIFLTALIGMLVFMIGLYLYKTLRGLPD